MDLASKNPPGCPNCDARHYAIATMLLVHGLRGGAFLLYIWLRIVDTSTVLDEELAELPVTVKHRSIQVEIFSKRRQGFAFGQQESHAADVAVVGAPLDERHAIAIRGCRGVALSHIVKYQVGAAVRDSVKHGRLFVSGHLLPSRHDSIGPTSGILRPPCTVHPRRLVENLTDTVRT
jgi:hypothetical protein